MVHRRYLLRAGRLGAIASVHASSSPRSFRIHERTGLYIDWWENR